MPKRFFGKKIDVKDESDVGNETDAPERPDLEQQSDAEETVIEGSDGPSFGGDLDEGEPESMGWGAVETIKLQNEIRDLKDKYLRAVAEFENIKKRHTKERSELLRYAGETLARDLLDVVDDLERASVQPATGEGVEILRGVQLIRDRFVSVLERHGITGTDSTGKVFDPKEHEALTSIPTADHPSGTVVEQFRKAYFFRDKLLRPAQVVVAAAPPAAAGSSGGNEGASSESGEE